MKKLLTLITIIFTYFTFGQSQNLINISYDAPKEYTIADIEVTGSKQISKSNILALSGLKKGDVINIPGDEINKAVKSIWKQKIVGDVTIYISKTEGYKVWLTIHLTELSRISEIEVSGIKNAEKKDLEEGMVISRGQVLTETSVKNEKLKMKKYYQEKGFYNAEIASSSRKDTNALTNNLDILTFDVNKGKKVKIDSIVINGNNEVLDKKIKRKLKNTKEQKTWRVWKRSKFIEKEFEEDKANLMTYLNENGYRDAQVKYEVKKIDKKHVRLILNITEGNKYYYRSIAWKGNHIYSDSILNSIFTIKPGDVYNKTLLDTKLNFNPNGIDISSLYMDKGYLFFSVNPVETSIENDSIDLELRIYEGNIARIKNIPIFGNTKTSEHVIRRELWTVPGDKFSRTDLINTQRKLSGMGYFDPEQIGIYPIPNPVDGTVDIEYHLVEKPSDQLQLSAGWGGGGGVGFIGTLGLVFNNFSLRKITDLKSWSPLPSGDGQQLSLQMRATGPAYQSYNFSFTEPWLGGKKPNMFSVSAYHSALRSGYSYSDGSYTGYFKNTGGSIGLGRQLNWPDRFFSLRNTLSLIKYDVNNYSGFPSAIKRAYNFSLITELKRSNIGNQIFIKDGSEVSISMALTPPYSNLNSDANANKWMEYHKWMIDGKWYFPLISGAKKQPKDKGILPNSGSRSLVLSVRAHMGFLARYNSDTKLGPFERFRLGGDGITGIGSSYLIGSDVIGLRGYNDATTLTPTAADGQTSGGVAYQKFVMELRYPIITEGAATIFILGFAEGGNNYGSLKEFNPFDLYRSVGVGARIFMPAFGMIGVDYGYGLDQVPGKPGQSGGQFHFTIGQQIR